MPFIFLKETARDEGVGVSPVDLTALSYAHVLSIPLVTDNMGMLLLAKEYEIKSLTSLHLLKLLYDCGAVTMEKIRTIASYWVYLKDTPASYTAEYRRIFKEAAPK